MKEIDLLTLYAKAWNNLDITYIEDYLTDDFEYTSQWVFDTIHGKEKYLKYLKAKFKSILENPLNIPQADLGYYKIAYGVRNKPCILLKQKDILVSIIVKVEDEKIIKADLVGIPPPETAISFNIFPK